MDYKFSIDCKIEKCEDCPCYSMAEIYSPQGYEHKCHVSGMDFTSVYCDQDWHIKDLTDDEFDAVIDAENEMDENCRIELFKQCPLKLIEG